MAVRARGGPTDSRVQSRRSRGDKRWRWIGGDVVVSTEIGQAGEPEALKPHALKVVVAGLGPPSQGPEYDGRDAFGLAEHFEQGATKLRVFKSGGPHKALRKSFPRGSPKRRDAQEGPRKEIVTSRSRLVYSRRRAPE